MVRSRWYNVEEQEVVVQIRVKTNAREDQVVEVQEDELRIQLKAKPIAGEANDALVRFLSKKLRVPQTQILIEQGLPPEAKGFGCPTQSRFGVGSRV